MHILSCIGVSIVAILHIGFFVLERFIWNTPTGMKIFRMTAEEAQAGAVLAANQGVYNLVLAIGLFWTLLAARSEAVTAIRYFILLFIVVVGIYGAITVGKNILFLQVFPAFLAFIFVFLESAQPRINDISTSFSNPPQFIKLAAARSDVDYSYPADFKTSQQEYYPEVSALQLNIPMEQAFSLALSVAKKSAWNIVVEDSKAFRFEASVSTRFFRFTDDMVVEIRQQDSAVELQMRSRSRTGKSDFGVNAKRIQDFFAKVKQAANL